MEMKIDPAFATAWVAEIQVAADDVDDERAHWLEDKLREIILEALANGTIDDAAECARIARTSQAIKFERWCAPSRWAAR